MTFEERLQVVSNVVDSVVTSLVMQGFQPTVKKNDTRIDDQVGFDVFLYDQNTVDERWPRTTFELNLYVFPDESDTQIEVFFHHGKQPMRLTRRDPEELEEFVMKMVATDMKLEAEGYDIQKVMWGEA